MATGEQGSVEIRRIGETRERHLRIGCVSLKERLWDPNERCGKSQHTEAAADLGLIDPGSVGRLHIYQGAAARQIEDVVPPARGVDDNLRRQRIRGAVMPWDETSSERANANSGSENPTERVLMAAEELNQVVQALEGMNVRTRTVLMLIKLEQMRIATVAEMLGISVSAVGKHLAKGISQLAALRKQQDRP